MLSPRDYTPKRRLVMTMVMWTILGGTVGLATWISKHPNPLPEMERFEQVEEHPVPFDQRMLREKN